MTRFWKPIKAGFVRSSSIPGRRHSPRRQSISVRWSHRYPNPQRPNQRRHRRLPPPILVPDTPRTIRYRRRRGRPFRIRIRTHRWHPLPPRIRRQPDRFGSPKNGQSHRFSRWCGGPSANRSGSISRPHFPRRDSQPLADTRYPRIHPPGFCRP